MTHPHPACKAEHLSKAQAETLNRTLQVVGENRHLSSLLRDLVKGCDDDHCPLCWQAQHERALNAEARVDVLGTRLALADRALRSKQDRHHDAYFTEAETDLERAVDAAVTDLRRKGA